MGVSQPLGYPLIGQMFQKDAIQASGAQLLV